MKYILIIVCTLHVLLYQNFDATPDYITTTFQTERVLPSDIIHITYILNTFKDNMERFHGYYSYPMLPDTFPNASLINTYYLNQFYDDYSVIKEFKNAASKNLLPSKTIYAYDHTFEVKFLSKHFLSIHENTYTFSGGAHPDIYTEAHTFSFQTGKEVLLNNLFLSTNTETENFIKQFLKSEISKKPEEYFPNAIQTIEKMSLKQFKFYISQNGITIFFNPYEIAPYARGVVEFNIMV